jgi:shikimate dehydrogenase
MASGFSEIETMQITGFTRLMYILADPVDHIQVTAVLNNLFDEWQVDVSVGALHVSRSDLPTVVSALRVMQNLVGCGVTIPHKIEIMPLLDECSERAKLVGAVNYVRREAGGALIGDNFDGVGFMAGLASEGIDVTGKRVMLVGAGGAARAIAFALAENAAHLAIVNRARDKADRLAAAVSAAFPGCHVSSAPADPAEFDLVVNATSLGMNQGEPLPFDVTNLTSRTTVAEIVMRPARTPLVVAAEERGCKVVLGRRMLDEQFGAVRRFMRL